jgi:hypothetical protein
MRTPAERALDALKQEDTVTYTDHLYARHSSGPWKHPTRKRDDRSTLFLIALIVHLAIGLAVFAKAMLGLL